MIITEQTQRQEAIMAILSEKGFVTVKELSQKLHYSTATINRDLNSLANLDRLVRTFGGARLADPGMAPFSERYNLYRSIKRQIACSAANLVEDGDTVFIDGSTTTQYMAETLGTKKEITVITNNFALAETLSELGVNALLVGGRIVEKPNVFGGDLALENILKFHADKHFFSTAGITNDGRILTKWKKQREIHITMMHNSDKQYFLVDSSKIGVDPKIVDIPTFLCGLDKIDAVISDIDFPDELREKFPETSFIRAVQRW